MKEGHGAGDKGGGGGEGAGGRGREGGLGEGGGKEGGRAASNPGAFATASQQDSVIASSRRAQPATEGGRCC